MADEVAQVGSLAPGRLFDLLHRLHSAWMLEEPLRRLYVELALRLQPLSWTGRAEHFLGVVLLAERSLSGAVQLPGLMYRADSHLLFLPAILLLLSLTALAGLVVFLNLLGRDRFDLLTSGGSFALGFLALALGNSLVRLVAEAGRVLAPAYHGCEVRSGELGLLLPMPTFPADTRDVWMAERRWRMAGAMAGASTLLGAGGAAVLILLCGPR